MGFLLGPAPLCSNEAILGLALTGENDAISIFTCQTMKVSKNAKARAVLGQVGDMDLRLLRVFKSVADCGGMAAAELDLNIGVSTISRHIKDLETRLGLV